MDFSKDCDSFEAVSEAIKTLDGLNQLITARHVAGYERHERLTNWSILGRFILDSCGNFMKMNKGSGYTIPADRYDKDSYPNWVVPVDGLMQFLEAWKKPGEYISVSSSPSWLPESDQVCPVCKNGWTIENCHDFVVSHDDHLIDAKDFIGQTVADFKANWNKDNHEISWFLRGERNLRNDKHIDSTIVINNIWKAEDKHQTNEKGWIHVEDDHVIETGDYLDVHLVTYRHEKCYRDHQAKEEHDYFYSIFQEAGFINFDMTEIPNQYHGGECLSCAPWFTVVADGITFTIGWRKRVISIHTSDPRFNFIKLFADQDVTKGYEVIEENRAKVLASNTYIHAWGKEKCIEYLKLIRHTSMNIK